MQAQTSQVVSHLPWGQLVWGEAQEECEQCPQFMVSEPLRQKAKGDESAKQHLNAWVGETQCRYPLAGNGLGLINLLKGVFP